MSIREKTTGFKHVTRVEVHLWDQLAGVVALDPQYGVYAFRFTPEFRSSGIDPAPLQMPIAEDRTFLFTDLPQETFKGLPAMLRDSLPDDFGNALIYRYMADEGLSAKDVTALDRLAFMSNRAMGALCFKPARGPMTRKPAAVDLDSLVTEARIAVHGTLDDDDQATASLRSIIEVGTSAGGARAKAVVAWNPETNEITSGHLDAPPGFEHWLLKFDGMGVDAELGATRDYGRIEYAYHLMALQAGLNMTQCRLLTENGRAHFMTRRFDRADGLRHHMQTLCGMSHLDYKKKGVNSYSQLFQTISELGLPYQDMEEGFRRMAFNVLARNCDDHTKNFSFLLKQGQAWELAPAYDVTFAHNPKGEWTQQHLMSVNGKFKNFTAEDLLVEASRFGIGTARRVLGQVQGAIKDWRKFAENAGVPTAIAAEIGERHMTLL